jgi:hypothetical protein
VVFTGYIDDSKDKDAALVSLGCVLADERHWERFEEEWRLLLKQTNRALIASGQSAISRYHASDCSCLQNEFSTWTKEQTYEITAAIRDIFQRHPVVIASYGVNISDVIEVFPEAEKKAHNLAHAILLVHIMKYLSDKVLSDGRWPEERLRIIHDHGDYDGVLLDTFKHEKENRLLKHREKFLTITPACSQDCILLQPADFGAYESFKDIDLKLRGKKRRKSLELVLELDAVGGRCAKIQRLGLQQFRDGLSIERLRLLFENARINPSRESK